ncbi:hypothetical protein Emag_001448 [Eimeria magna]
MVPVRIADVFSALFRSNKPVFSQLLTGNSQYDQRELQALRQKSLLLSSKRDGCLYVFLKKFLLRVSLRGTVTVVADLLQLALAAAGRICPDKPVSLPSSIGTFGAASQPHLAGSQEGDARSGAASPVFRVNSLSHVFKSLGCEDDRSISTNLHGNERWTSPPICQSPSQSSQLDEFAVSRIIKRQVLQTVRQARKRLQSITDEVSGSSGSSERLQEFFACRGEGWEVNNCSIDGEGHCFYTVTHEKALSPLQQRGPVETALGSCRLMHFCSTGMIFCIDTQGAVPRSRILRFGRGVSEDAVLSLSLSAHPVIGCFLVVVKSASAVYGNVLGTASASSSSAGTDSNEEGLHESEEFTDDTTLEKPWGNDTTGEACRSTRLISECSEASDQSNIEAVVTSNEPLAAASHYVEGTENQPEVLDSPQQTSVRPSEGEPVAVAEGDAVHEQTSRESQPTPTPRGEHLGVHAVETASLLGSLGDRQATVARRPGSQIQVGESVEGTKNETVADEHSMWWFCPCQQDPRFYFPVAEWLHASNAAHAAAALVASAADTELRREKTENSLSSRLLPSTHSSGSASCEADHAVHVAASRALQEAATAAARAESAPSSGYILWQPGVKVRRPKTGEQVIDFGSAVIIRARTAKGLEPNKTIHAVGPCPQRGRRSLGCITETVAVISQDARHLEVRDALPSPLGFIVVPAEAANRIVKQSSEEFPGRLGSRNPVSLTSFLASFVMRTPPAIQNRAEGGGVNPSAGGTGSDDGRQAPTDGQGVSAELAAGGATAQTPESSHQRAIPAVNVVFLVDTLRLCRFAGANVVSPASQTSGPTWSLHEEIFLNKREDIQPGNPAESTSRATAWPLIEKSESSRKSEGSTKLFPSFIEDDLTNGSKLESAPDNGQRCSCKTSNFCSVGDSSARALHPHFADVLLLCADGIEIPSHRALLAARCSFFEARLTRAHWEARGNGKVVIDLRDFPGSVVKTTAHAPSSARSPADPAVGCASVGLPHANA